MNKRPLIKLGVTSALMTLMLTGCAVTKGSWDDTMANMAYPLADAPNGVVQLESGRADVELAPDSASRYKVQMMNLSAMGDINNDKWHDGIAVIRTESGGSGSHYYLAIALWQEQVASMMDATYYIGDRVVIYDLQVADGDILVKYYGHAPGQALSEAPEVDSQLRLRYDGTELVVLP